MRKFGNSHLIVVIFACYPRHFTLPCVNKFLGIRNEVQQINDKMLPGIR